VRRDAITGLKEILAVKPEREVGKVIRALGGQIADDVSEPLQDNSTGLLTTSGRLGPEGSAPFDGMVHSS
jgi:hypothetical protein